ncbi:MAG: glycosyltransferase family 2 protein [Candidatus Omnitrophota bacterium]
MKILVSPIAFNEEVKLRSVVERFLKSPLAGKVDYCVVDDGSNDGTQKMLQGFAPRGVRTLRHAFQSGVGAAIRTAIKHARANGYEVLVIMAGNDKDNPDELPVLLKEIDNGFDFVQGSRYKGKVGTGGDMPFYRKIATRLHPWLMSFFLGVRITDSTNGYRAFRLSLFNDARINIDQPWLNAYELEPYLIFKAIKLKYKFTEVFVTKIYPPKKLGYTKMKPLLGWWSILKPVFYLGLGIKK